MSAAIRADMSCMWPHQREAVDVFRRYLADDKATGYALVSMPTGSGKTAVIAGLVATVGNCGKDVVVVTPWSGLVAQLREDIAGRVWRNMGVEPPEDLTVLRVPSIEAWKAKLTEVRSGRRVWVTTIQMVLALWNDQQRASSSTCALFDGVDFAVVDECQYEPSEFWSQAIRAMGLKACLLTATAFRNDSRYFDIADKYQYRFAHKNATADHFVRTPRFCHLNQFDDETTFVTALLAAATDAGLKAKDRVIVRCGSKQSIERIVEALRIKGETAVGFHHRFDQRSSAYLQ